MSPTGSTFAITGAGGFVGRHLCRHFLSRGSEVRGLVRDTESPPLREQGVELFECDLPDRIDAAAFRGVDVLIHCAYTSRFVSLEEARRVNEEGSARVLALSREANVKRFVFVSSTSAHPEALSYYGKSKLAIENRLDPARDLIVRPGLVLGPDGGLFQRLVASLRRSGVLPLFGGGRQPVQTVHIDDLCIAMERAIERGLTGRYVVAEPQGLPLRELLRLTARKLGRRAIPVPLPAGPVLACLRLTEALRIPLPVSSENVLGSLALREQPSADDLEAIGVRLRSAEESLDQLLPPPRWWENRPFPPFGLLNGPRNWAACRRPRRRLYSLPRNTCMPPNQHSAHVFIVVPAYNEARTIRGVVDELLAHYPNVVVVDDGSTDGTAEGLEESGALILRHCANRGQGASLQTGIEFALLRGAEAIVTFDADGQHDVNDIATMLQPLFDGECDVALGSRFLGRTSNMPWTRRLLLKLGILFTLLVSRVRATDVHNGLRAFTAQAASELSINMDRMAHASEIFDQIRLHDWRYKEIPVTIRYTNYSLAKGQTSWDALRIAFQVLLEKLRR